MRTREAKCRQRCNVTSVIAIDRQSSPSSFPPHRFTSHSQHLPLWLHILRPSRYKRCHRSVSPLSRANPHHHTIHSPIRLGIAATPIILVLLRRVCMEASLYSESLRRWPTYLGAYRPSHGGLILTPMHASSQHNALFTPDSRRSHTILC